ncbi:helix-turn-helix domain-containing protein [Streptococcus agalactiae]|nr:helix-turn-helix domain-containing protein [Streptococcus agalactiae]
MLVKDRKLSLREISEDTGINYSTIGNYNQGIRIPNARNAAILADYFRVSVGYLLGYEKEPNLINPGDESLIKGLFRVAQGKTNLDKVTEWTPFKDDVSFVKTMLLSTPTLERKIDEIFEGIEPNIIQALKQRIKEVAEEFPYTINHSGDEKSDYHFVWQAWEESDEYKKRMAEKHKK